MALGINDNSVITKWCCNVASADLQCVPMHKNAGQVG